MELIVNGHGEDISMDAQGNIFEIEEEVASPGLTKAAGAGKTRTH